MAEANNKTTTPLAAKAPCAKRFPLFTNSFLFPWTKAIVAINTAGTNRTKVRRIASTPTLSKRRDQTKAANAAANEICASFLYFVDLIPEAGELWNADAKEAAASLKQAPQLLQISAVSPQTNPHLAHFLLFIDFGDEHCREESRALGAGFSSAIKAYTLGIARN
jgi:hypothetical protein